MDVVFAPAADAMYAADYATIVHVGGPLTDSFEAAERPSHFDGVASIVTKLLNITQPDAAFFGQKDAQQLAVIRRVARDLDLPVEIVGAPTVREPDGLALSSRNVYLTPEQRAVAPGLYLALLAGARAAGKPGAGPRDAIATAAMALADAGRRAQGRRGPSPRAARPDGARPAPLHHRLHRRGGRRQLRPGERGSGRGHC